MLKRTRKSMLGAGVALAVVATGLVGCGGGVDKGSLRAMPHDRAWQQIEDQAQTASTMNAMSQYVPGTRSLAQEYKVLLDNQKREAEEAARRADTPEDALRQMVEDVSTYLMTSLPADARRRGVDQYRLNLAMGELVNRDNDPALRQALTLIRSELVNNDTFTEQFRILASNQSRANDIIRDLASNRPEYFDPEGRSAGTADYNPASLYVAEGETFIRRLNNNRELVVTTEVRTSHVQTRDLVGSKVFSRRYFFHPGDGAFITEEENERRRASYGTAAAR